MAFNDELSALRREVENLKSIIKTQRLELRAEILYNMKLELEGLKREKEEFRLFERNMRQKVDLFQRDTEKRLGDLYKNSDLLKQEMRAQSERKMELLLSLLQMTKNIDERLGKQTQILKTPITVDKTPALRF